MKSTREIKERIIQAGYRAVDQLIKVAEEDIIKSGVDYSSEDGGEGYSLAADKLKNAAATKKLAIFDAFEILSRIESEKENLDSPAAESSNAKSKQGFVERRAR